MADSGERGTGLISEIPLVKLAEFLLAPKHIVEHDVAPIDAVHLFVLNGFTAFA